MIKSTAHRSTSPALCSNLLKNFQQQKVLEWILTESFCSSWGQNTARLSREQLDLLYKVEMHLNGGSGATMPKLPESGERCLTAIYFGFSLCAKTLPHFLSHVFSKYTGNVPDFQPRLWACLYSLALECLSIIALNWTVMVFKGSPNS